MCVLHAHNPELERLRQKDGKFEANLYYLARHLGGGSGEAGVEDQPQLPRELPANLGFVDKTKVKKERGKGWTDLTNGWDTLNGIFKMRCKPG